VKTKKEIKEAIVKIKTKRDNGKFLKQKLYVEVCNGQMRALRWALGYKAPAYYFCTQCQLVHRGIKCPRCGDATEILLARGQDNANTKI